VGKPESKRLFERPRPRCVIILLKWIFKEKHGDWGRFIWLRIRISVDVL
jgi:hypothetical protein